MKFGIAGDGPWPVILAGYVLNALDRPEAKSAPPPICREPGTSSFRLDGPRLLGQGHVVHPTGRSRQITKAFSDRLLPWSGMPSTTTGRMYHPSKRALEEV